MESHQFCALSVRRLTPGSWEMFREAWDAREQQHHDDDLPPFVREVYHLRSREDENLVISFGIADGDIDDMREWLADPAHQLVEQRRQLLMAPYVTETLIDTVFDVVEHIVPAGVH